MDNRRYSRTDPEAELGVSTLYSLGSSFNNIPRLVRKKNVSHWEIFDDGPHSLNPSRVRQLVLAARSRDVSFSVHGPICDLNPATLNPDLEEVVMRRLARSLQNASLLSAETWVLHPGTHGGLSWVLPGRDRKVNMGNLRRLARLATRLGVRVAIENISSSLALLGRVQDFQRLYLGWNGAPGLALGLGHSHIRGETYSFMKRLAGRIVHVHAHDNRGDYDKHLAIGTGTVPWLRVMQALLTTGFTGRLVIESTAGPFSSLSTIRKLLRTLQ